MKHYFFALVIILIIISCKTPSGIISQRNIKLNKTYLTESGLKYKVTGFGNETKAQPGDKVFVHYIGKIKDGNEFDNSYKLGYPFAFILGRGQVIKGWDEGIALLNEGDTAVLTIPPNLGYGSIEIPGSIPANSTLIFEVILVKVKSGEGN